MLKAVTRQATQVDNKIKAINSSPENTEHPISTAHFFDHHATPEDVAVMVMEQDFVDAHRELVPSVSAGELQHYERVRATFEGGASQGSGSGSSRDGPPPNAASRRPMSSASKGSGKGKGKPSFSGKGKGKAVAMNSGDEFSDSAEEPTGVNGSVKGKGKAAASAFHDGAPSDDEGLYE